MKTLCLAVSIALSTATAAALHAQASSASNDPNSHKVTVTGCVEKASPAETPTGTSGTAGAISPDTKFVLTSPSVGTAAGTSGTGDAPAAIVYRLDDADQAKVSAHEGHKVEVTGTIQDRQEGAEASEPASSAKAAPVPKLKVESVKMLSSSCSR